MGEFSHEFSPTIALVSDSHPDLDRLDRLHGLARWAGISLPLDTMARLTVYESWLRDEAIPAGGIGPNEAERLWDRHIVDSLLFAGLIEPGDSVLDIGSGVGLPGIPVALVRPDCVVTLLDRSGRRYDLARRAVRVIGLDNVDVVQGDITTHIGHYSVVVSRASLPPRQLLTAVTHLTGINRVVVAGSRVEPPEVPDGWEAVAVPTEIVGEDVWFLRAWLSRDGAG